MGIMSRHIPFSVRLPDGSTLSLSDLPASTNCRWTAKRKAVVVQAVEHGLLHMNEAMLRYDISGRELTDWISGYSENGVQALRAGPAKSRRVIGDPE